MPNIITRYIFIDIPLFNPVLRTAIRHVAVIITIISTRTSPADGRSILRTAIRRVAVIIIIVSTRTSPADGKMCTVSDINIKKTRSSRSYI